VCLLSRFSRDWRKEDALIPTIVVGTSTGEALISESLVRESAEAIVGFGNELSKTAEDSQINRRAER